MLYYQKPGDLSATGLLVVDKMIEPLAARSQISNLDLSKDLAKVIDFLTK